MPNNFVTTPAKIVLVENWDMVKFQLDTTGAQPADVSGYAHSLSFGASVTLDSSFTKFNQKTLKLANTGVQAIRTDVLAEFNFTNQDMCIDGWWKFDDMTLQNSLFRFENPDRTTTPNTNSYNPYLMAFNDGYMYLRSANTGSNIAAPQPHRMVQGQMHHVEVDKVGNSWYVFVDGVMIMSGSSASLPQPILDNPKAFSLGEINTGGSRNIYGVRVQIGSARHTANFTPPTAPPLVG